MNNALARVIILSSILVPAALNISTTLAKCPRALSDFLAFGAVDTMLYVTSDSGPSTVGASFNIAGSEHK